MLTALAVVSGGRLDDDSYGHYARSSKQVLGADWRTWLTDVWNKPLPGLAYGLASIAGLTGARWVACVFSVGAAYFTRQLVASWTPLSRSDAAWLPGMFFAQLAVLKDSFVTMTELPAAFFLAWSLFALHGQGRAVKAAALAGLVPLCRVEMLPVVLVTGAACALRTWSQNRHASPLRRILGAATALALPGLPFAAWVCAGIGATGDLHWFSRASYASWRTHWELPALLHYNTVTGLVNVLSPPLLLALICGLFTLGTHPRRLPKHAALHLASLLFVHYVLLNVLVVYPKDWYGVAPGHGVAAINGRNYSVTAPVLIAWLSGTLVTTRDAAASSTTSVSPRTWLCLTLATATTAALVYWSKGHDRGDLAVHWVSLGLAAGLLAWRMPRDCDAKGFGVSLPWLSLAGCVATLVIRPFFWYPTTSTDFRALAAVELAKLVASERPPLVLQDSVSSLEVTATENALDVSTSRTDWVWPGQYETLLDGAPVGTWVVFELDGRGEPRSRYAPSLLARTESEGFVRVAEFRSPPHEGLRATIDRLSARNTPVGFRVMRLEPSGKH